jgi:hypothetical protein
MNIQALYCWSAEQYDKSFCISASQFSLRICQLLERLHVHTHARATHTHTHIKAWCSLIEKFFQQQQKNPFQYSLLHQISFPFLTLPPLSQSSNAHIQQFSLLIPGYNMRQHPKNFLLFYPLSLLPLRRVSLVLLQLLLLTFIKVKSPRRCDIVIREAVY